MRKTIFVLLLLIVLVSVSVIGAMTYDPTTKILIVDGKNFVNPVSQTDGNGVSKTDSYIFSNNDQKFAVAKVDNVWYVRELDKNNKIIESKSVYTPDVPKTETSQPNDNTKDVSSESDSGDRSIVIKRTTIIEKPVSEVLPRTARVENGIVKFKPEETETELTFTKTTGYYATTSNGKIYEIYPNGNYYVIDEKTNKIERSYKVDSDYSSVNVQVMGQDNDALRKKDIETYSTVVNKQDSFDPVKFMADKPVAGTQPITYQTELTAYNSARNTVQNTESAIQKQQNIINDPAYTKDRKEKAEKELADLEAKLKDANIYLDMKEQALAEAGGQKEIKNYYWKQLRNRMELSYASIGNFLQLYEDNKGFGEATAILIGGNYYKYTQMMKNEMRQTFCVFAGISNCIESQICGQMLDTDDGNVLAGRGPGGQFVKSGSLTAEKSLKVNVASLSRQQLQDLFSGANTTTIKGKTVNFTDPTFDPKILGAINLRRYTFQLHLQNNNNEQMKYNIYFKGTTEKQWFSQDQVLEIGQQNITARSITSANEYEEICAKFHPGLPSQKPWSLQVGGEGYDTNELCVPFVEYQGGATLAGETEAQQTPIQTGPTTEGAGI